MSTAEVRYEKDSLGDVAIPIEALWGPQTQRSKENFKIGPTMPYPVISALIHIKRSAALANCELGVISEDKKDVIVAACDELLKNDYTTSFPLVVYQTGSGTQTNMNVNEVINHVAAKINPNVKVHPNDDVNKSQSSNDIFPAAMNIAAVRELTPLMINLQNLIDTFRDKETEYMNTVKLGRTHLQDATPITFGQEISGWRSSLEHDLKNIKALMPHLYELALGGTAVGTGLNSPAKFDKVVCKYLQEDYGLPFCPAPNKFQALTSHAPFNLMHSSIKALAGDLVKIGNDIRFLASGPRGGYGEISIPENEPGSSIMPGKVNPTQVEAMVMVCARVFGNDVTINFAASQGNFELNVYRPVIIETFLESITLLAETLESFDSKLAKGMKANPERMMELVEHSLMTVTALVPHIGYEKSAKIAQKAQKENITLREAAIASGNITSEQFDEYIKPLQMANVDRHNAI